eukprot:3029518-Pyramimonas_sp.AAC.1
MRVVLVSVLISLGVPNGETFQICKYGRGASSIIARLCGICAVVLPSGMACVIYHAVGDVQLILARAGAV